MRVGRKSYKGLVRKAGQSLVEMALVLPLLVWLFLGATDLARSFYYYVALQNATREAARVLIDYPEEYTDSKACNAGAQAAAPFLTISCAGGSITITPAANGGGNPPSRQPGRHPVTVTATYTFTPVTIFIQKLTGGSITLKASTTMLTWY